MSLFEVIDLGDDDSKPATTPTYSKAQPPSKFQDKQEFLATLDKPYEEIEVTHPDITKVPDLINIDSESDNDSIDIFDTIFISDDESGNSSSDDVIFEAARKRKPKRSLRSKEVPKRARKDSITEHSDICIDQIKINGLLLVPGINVQLRYGAVLSDRSVLESGYFMRIKKIFCRHEIYRDGTEIVQNWIQGPLFRRHRDLDGILPKTAGEVAMLREKVEIRAADAMNVREIVLTNLLGRETVRKSYEDAKDDAYGRLVCRWKAKIKDNTNGNTGMQQLGATGYIRRLTEAEADPNYRISDMELSKLWRAIPKDETENLRDSSKNFGFIDTLREETKTSQIDSDDNPIQCQESETIVLHNEPELIDLEAHSFAHTKRAGHSFSPIYIEDSDDTKPDKNIDIEILEVPYVSTTETDLPNSRFAIDLSNPTGKCQLRKRRKYTFGDAFCGAGGATRGAVLAGFKVRWGVDHDEAAIKAWRSNFGRSIGYQEDVHEFVSRHGRKKTQVDLLHLSPPCQFFSWARTIPGKNDEKNEASFFVIPNTLNSCRPRAVTVEETDGLIGLSRSVGHFKCMLGDFTSIGYSVKYAILNAASYGVPSKRKRLVLIACCPGETLADFPNPTHWYSTDPFEPMPRGLHRAITLRDAITKIPRYTPDHDIEILEAVAPSSLKLPPHEWEQPFRSTIKCGGGEYNLHPSRNRKFTLRELACLQSFPLEHNFYGKRGEKMRQIGNAFPPKLVGAVMEAVRKHLEKTDDEWEGGGIL
ncbi:hypothetical protein H072_9507 [Dactylellina haptotyla CBS 200.50]|uniref:DNA (cytosine-5-)-methyltransferase n=1 Tax=Dactylellina haptotyla (strain CBS 200.50) TaxID=1284197 RepID=S8A2E7_DACHA|nr:hypothetical protein H072_9507 [Dactylellina haptotyla CBS 200.50]